MDSGHPFYGASHKVFYPYDRQQQPLTQSQRAPAQNQFVASYKPTVPSGSEMPDEWGYHTSRTAQVSNAPSHVQGVSHQTESAPHGVPQPFPSAAPTVPTCRCPNCHRPVTKDINTHELSEYCSKEHMQEDLMRGVPACLACRRCPRRINSNYCGSSCEKWAMERQRRDQQSPPIAQAPVPPGSFNWGSIAGGSPSAGHPAAGYQPQGPLNPPVGGLVRCPQCGTRYRNHGGACPSCDYRLAP